MPPTRPCRILTDLPPDIWPHIAEHIDLDSAHFLAQTCRGLQDVGESIIWRELDLLPFPEEVIGPSTAYDSTTLDFGAVFATLTVGSGAPRGLSSHTLTAKVIANRMAEGLTARPARTAFVRKVAMKVTKYDFEVFADLLQLVQGSIVELQVMPHISMCLAVAELGHPRHLSRELEERLARTISALPKLRVLSISLDPSWRSIAALVLRKAPLLHSVAVVPPATYVSFEPDAPPDPCLSLPAIPGLINLHVEEMRWDISRAVLNLVQGAKALDAVQIWMVRSGASRQKKWIKTIFFALQACLALTSLETEEWLWKAMSGEIGFEALEELGLRRQYDGCFSQMLDVGVRLGLFCPLLTARPRPTPQVIGIPRLPRLEAVYYTPVRDDTNFPSLPLGIFPCLWAEPNNNDNNNERAVLASYNLDSATGILPSTLEMILDSPNFVLLLITTTLPFGPLPTQDVFHTTRGEPSTEHVFVRTYSSGADLFVHLKVRTHKVFDERGQIHHLRVAVDRDCTSYKGKYLSMEQIEKVRALTSELWAEEDGGRGKSMPAECWDMLETWFQRGDLRTLDHVELNETHHLVAD